MKKWISVWMALLLILPVMTIASGAAAQEDIKPFDVNAKSAVLMDAHTGTVLYAKNANEALPPASVTKVMTLLLIMEAIDGGNLSLQDTVSVSEYAASMGGSQVYLEPYEEMTVEDLLKSVVISSANDAAVALAEKVSGSEEAFVNRMNERAAELGMENTHFENVTGLDDDVENHTLSALDIALVSRELITKHPLILQYSSIWMDTIRDGAFGLSNTNRLIRFYSGATGLKTGSTSKAGFCISATASRDGMHLIAVIMGSETRDIRNAAATQLLDWGFANYAVYTDEGGDAGEIKVLGGIESSVPLTREGFSALLSKGKEKNVEVKIQLEESVNAPVKEGDVIGKVQYICDGEELGEANILAAETVKKIGYGGILLKMLKKFCLY
ncbi:MAG: D-alanyl-D-alanine carboxypeptidase [Clostridiales bacterium]|nr:D-alanyl-D-alanine carboxypeptidase [Clostridiales bacterium]